MREMIAGENFLSLILMIVFIAIIVQFYRYAYSKSDVPSIQANSLLFYFMIRKNLTTEVNQNNVPFAYLLLQYLCGICKMFENQKIFQGGILNRKSVFLFKPETVEVILKSATEVNKAAEYNFLEPWLGISLLTSKRDKWRVQRKLLTPPFHFNVLNSFLPHFDEQAKVLVSKLKTSADKPWVDVVPLITMCTLDIIGQTAMGVALNAQNGGHKEYVEALSRVGGMVHHRAVRPWLWNDTVFYLLPLGRRFKRDLKILHNSTRMIIREKKQEMLEDYSKNGKRRTEQDVNSPKKGKAFLEMLLEHHLADNSLTEEDICGQVDTVLFGGHDTTAVGISCVLYLLGLDPEVQENAIQEIDCIFEADITRPVTRDDLGNMKYLDCVIKEALRIYPPVPFIAREITEDTKIFNYNVNAGYTAFIFIYMLHRDPETFPNPEKFDPERFLPENCHGRNPYAHIPFSAGPRNCIGQKNAMMEIKVVVVNILRHFRIESLDPRDKVKFSPHLVTLKSDPIRLNFIERF